MTDGLGHNATFLAFKPSGKWYASGRGVLPDFTDRFHDISEKLRLIIAANGGAWPGLTGTGLEFVRVVQPDDDGVVPLMFGGAP